MTAAPTVRPVAPVGGVHRRRRWPILLAAGLILILLGGAGYLVRFTGLLGVHTVAVSGVTGDLAIQVRGALDVPDGTPLIAVDLAAAERRIEQIPEVASATVRRSWPNTLEVAALVRTPVAVTSANGGLWLLDSGGTPYLRVPSAPSGLVTVQLATPGSDDPATKAALKVVGAMTSEFRATVASVSAPSQFSVSVLLDDGRTVIWGGPGDGARKMQILPALLQQPGKTYNISVPDMVTVR